MADEVLLNCLGKEKFDTARIIYKGFKNIEEPDLLIYKPDFLEIRFAESKKLDTRDKWRENQVRRLALIKLLFGCEVDVFGVVEEGKEFALIPLTLASV